MMIEEYVREVLNKGRRIDGRRFDEYRKIIVEKDIIEKAEGSARVKLGNTEVIAGVKLNVLKPFPDTPEEGVLIVNAEFLPIAHEEYEPGPPGEDEIELARVVDRAIRESKAIKLEELCIEPSEKVWGVFIDITVINDDGNLMDAACLAATAALEVTKIPKYEEDKIIRGEYQGKLPLRAKPVIVTVAKYGRRFLVDLKKEEEEIIDTKVSIGVFDGKVCAIQKQGQGYISLRDIETILELALRKSQELKKVI